jgi:hypothetical protein
VELPSEGNRLIRRIDEAIRYSPISRASAVARFPLLIGGSWNDPMTILADKRISTDRQARPSVFFGGELLSAGSRQQKGNANRATLAVARKLVAYLVAVDRRQKEFLTVERENRTAA